MKKKVNIQEIDFEVYLDNALKSYGYLFPETDEQISTFEENMDQISIPEDLDSPDFVFKFERRIFLKNPIFFDNPEGEKNWAIAARDGKDIPSDILEKMAKDKEEAKKKQNGNQLY